ncbi:MAG: YncE family protein [Acidobacteria bacterium]|nr:YncE family protein [Acidobacteriota bacterium]
MKFNPSNNPAKFTRAISLALRILVAFSFAPLFGATPKIPAAESEPSYLTPLDLQLSPDGSRIYVVCEGNDSLIAVDTHTNRVVAQVKVGHKPKGLALTVNGKTLYVANEWSDTVSEIDGATLAVRRTLKAGWGPTSLVVGRDGRYLYVANGIGNSVSVIDLATGKELRRFSSQRSPQHMALSRDGRRVYVSNVLPHLRPYDEPPISELTVIDTQKQVVAERILVPGVIELREIAEAPARQGGYLLVPFMRPKNLAPLIRVEQGWVLTHGIAVVRPPLTRSPVAGSPSPQVRGSQSSHATVSLNPLPSLSGRGWPAGPGEGEVTSARVTQVLLDDIDYYYADGYGAAFTPDGRYALITSSGANVVQIVDTARLAGFLRRNPAVEIANRLDSARQFVIGRLPTGADPRGVAVSPDGRKAYVANRMDDSLTVVDLARLRVTSTIDLGGPKEDSRLRRGERLFRDARYCLQGQFSCATCHPEQHLDGLAWNLETPQLGRDRVANRTLRGIAETAPYKWNGHNPDLITQCGPRIAKFLFRSEGFNTQELQALVAFLRSIPLAPNRHLAANGQLTDAQERGKAVFYRRRTNDGREIPYQNRCDTCHPPDTHYTNRISTDVGSKTQYDTISLFDTPQLDRVYEDAPYLHNGMALTLEEIWTIYNNYDTHGVTSDMRKEQLNDLIEYLKTL